MTNKKNNTANSRALNDPKVRKALKSLQEYWDVLSQPEQIERVNDLLKFGCSRRGIADETKIPLSTLSRHSVPKPLKPRKDPRPGATPDLNKESQKRRRPSAIDAARESQAMFQKLKASRRGEIEGKEMAKEEQKPFIAQQPVIPAADSVIETSPKGEETSEKGSHTQNDQPKSGQRELFEAAQVSRVERRQRLATIPDQIKARPQYTARSMRRQGI